MSDSQNQNDTPASKSRNSGMLVNVFGRTDVGLVREHNEDNFLVADLSSGNRSIKPEVREHEVGAKGSLFAVCDGMGGAVAGEVASKIAVDTIYEMMQEGEPPEDDEALARRLDAAIQQAGKRIFAAAKEDRKQRGMGTTVTAAVMIGSRLIIGQVGDSRAYILRSGKLIQVTKDQSLVQQLLDAKQLTEEEAKNFEKSNIILQALGTALEIQVDMTSVVLRRGDALVMCSDGLSGIVEPAVITEIVQSTQDTMEACKKLTDLACEGGGHDNITVIIARFDGPGLSEPVAEEELSYRKYRFSPSAETTQRSRNLLIMEKPADEAAQPEYGVQSWPPPAPPREVAPTRHSNGEGRTQTGLFAAAGIILLVGIAFIAFTMSQSSDGRKDAEGGVTVPIEPSNPSMKAPSQGEESSSENTSASEETILHEPQLPPIPADALTGEDAMTPEAKPGTKAEKQIVAQQQKIKVAGSAEKPKGKKQATASKPAQDEPEEKTPAQVEDNAPRPIDENPF